MRQTPALILNLLALALGLAILTSCSQQTLIDGEKLGSMGRQKKTVSLAKSAVKLSESVVASGESVTLRVTLKAEDETVIAGTIAPETFKVSQVTALKTGMSTAEVSAGKFDGDDYVFAVKGVKAGEAVTVKVDLTDYGELFEQPMLTVKPGVVDSSKSSLRLASDTLILGTTSSAVLILKDREENLIRDQETLAATRLTLSATSGSQLDFSALAVASDKDESYQSVVTASATGTANKVVAVIKRQNAPVILESLTFTVMT